MVRCDECGKQCDGERGLRSHQSQMKPRHKQNPVTDQVILPPEPDIDVPDPPGDPPPDQPTDEIPPPADDRPVVCLVCGQSFANLRGYDSHRSSHPVEANTGRLLPPHLRTNANSNTDTSPPQIPEGEQLLLECDKWTTIFDKLLRKVPAGVEPREIENTYNEFSAFLYAANKRIGLPEDPRVVMHRKRRSGIGAPTRAGQSTSSNPSRSDIRARDRNKRSHKYKLIQHYFGTERNKAVRMVLSGETEVDKRCKIPLPALEEHFRAALSSPNDLVLEEYPQEEVHREIEVTLAEVRTAIMGINRHSGKGPDGILTMTVRELPVAGAIKRIIEIMLATGHVPSRLTEARTTLIYKEGDENNVSNWRPLSVFSVVRRVIERVIDRKLRSQVSLDPNQHGFVSGIPGCQVNTTLVDACLRQAHSTNTDCYTVFLDISKAFDRVGHTHIQKCLDGQGVSPKLKRLTMALLTGSSTRICSGGKKSALIPIKRSVPQGGPLSPQLFNIAIDHVYKDLCSPEFARDNGYFLSADTDPLSLLGFADDQAALSRTKEGALQIIETTKERFASIGLQLNPRKSKGIQIIKGKLVPGQLQLADGSDIELINEDQRIRYLGVTFKQKIVFDRTTVGDITERLNNLIKSPYLHCDQKLTVVNAHILPMLTHQIQCAPRKYIPAGDQDILDMNIKATVKAVMQLHTKTCDEYLYAPRSARGAGAMCVRWEVQLQRFNIARRLLNIRDPRLQLANDWQQEINEVKSKLGVEGETARQLRNALRKGQIAGWHAKVYQGVGAKHFLTCPKANRILTGGRALSTAQRIAIDKLSTNYANLAAVPGSKKGQLSGALCRRCQQKPESIQHTIGECPYGSLMRNKRHDAVKNRITQLLREKGFACFEEVSCVDERSNRRADIVAFEPGATRAYIIDPTVRYESEADVDAIVQAEKEAIYGPCVADINKRYEGTFGERQYEVIGLWWGARGSVSTGVLNFFDRFRLSKREMLNIAGDVLLATVQIVQHHIYTVM